MPTIAFDVRYDDGTGNGLQVDAGIYVELYENEETLKDTRVKGTSPMTSVVELQDGAGYLYRTIVDLTNYLVGKVKAVWHATKDSNAIADFTEVLDWPSAPGAFTSSYIRKYVLAKLGSPVVGIELTDGQTVILVDEAVRIYNTFVGRQQKKHLTLTLGVQGYALPNVGSRGVCKVDFTRKGGHPFISDPFFGREFARNQPTDFDQYVMGISYWKALQRVGGQECDWLWDPIERKLYVDLGPSNQGTEALWDATYWYYEDVPIQEIPAHHHQYVLDLSLALAKKMVGEMREKYGGSVPSPGGGIQMNGTQLKQEGETLEERTRATLINIGCSEVVPEFG